MTLSLKRTRQEGLDHSNGFLFCDEAARQSDGVSIVVLTGQASYLEVPAKCRTDVLMLIQSDVDTLAAATHGNARIAFAQFNRRSAQMGKISIVTTFFAVGTEVLEGNTL